MIELFVHKEQRNAVAGVQHGDGSIMIWSCFASSGTAALDKVDGILGNLLNSPAEPQTIS